MPPATSTLCRRTRAFTVEARRGGAAGHVDHERPRPGPTNKRLAVVRVQLDEPVSPRCKLDGPGATTGTYVSCTSPRAVGPLADGALHVLGLRDRRRRQPRCLTLGPTRAFTPSTRRRRTRRSPGGPSGTTTSTSQSFTFTSPSRAATFECKLDTPAGVGTYAACTSPQAYTTTAGGATRSRVRATDAAGNVDASPATRTWTIQADAPPPPSDDQPVAAYVYSPAAPVVGQPVRFDASGATCDDTPCTYTWADDGTDGAGGKQWPLGSGEEMTFTFQGTGTKNVRVAVTDADGDRDSTMKAITVGASAPTDTTPPETTIDSGPEGDTDDSTPTFAFSSSERGSAFECRVDSGSWRDCASPWIVGALSNGSHTVSVRATDPAGNDGVDDARGEAGLAAARRRSSRPAGRGLNAMPGAEAEQQHRRAGRRRAKRAVDRRAGEQQQPDRRQQPARATSGCADAEAHHELRREAEREARP